MTTHLDENGQRYMRCFRCGAKGPSAVTARSAKAKAKEAGWARVNAAGEEYICPACRVPRQHRDEPTKIVVHLVSPTNPRFSLCGRHHVDVTDDEAEMNCGLCQRSLDRVSRSPSAQEE